MSHITLPYTKIIIPSHGQSLEKAIYCPILETILINNDRQTNFSFRSVVDSGADFCVFPAKFGEIIGLDVKSGNPVPSFGVGGREILYFHEVKIGVTINDEIWSFPCSAGFSYKMNPKGTGLLGRKGFFDAFDEIAFNQKKRMFRLKE